MMSRRECITWEMLATFYVPGTTGPRTYHLSTQARHCNQLARVYHDVSRQSPPTGSSLVSLLLPLVLFLLTGVDACPVAEITTPATNACIDSQDASCEPGMVTFMLTNNIQRDQRQLIPQYERPLAGTYVGRVPGKSIRQRYWGSNQQGVVVQTGPF